jgi:KaiC/GvpD/RAD55 family RecA-like ATPase
MMLSPEQQLLDIGAQVLRVSPTNPADHSPPPLKCFTSVEFLSMTLKPRSMILDPIIRTGGLAMLSAFRGVGKTQVAIGIAHAVASGGRFLVWNAPLPRRVLYVDGEMPGEDLQVRLRMLSDIDSDYLRILPMDEQELGITLNLAQRDSQEKIEALLQGAELLILDNRSTLAAGGKENEAESWDSMQQWLLSLRRRGVSVLLVEHEGRNGNPRGTSKREDVLDTLISLKRPEDYTPEDGARFEVHKARGVFGDAAAPFEAKLAVRAGLAEWTTRPLVDVNEELVMTLTLAGQSIREIEKETGIPKSTVGRIQTKLRAEGRVP